MTDYMFSWQHISTQVSQRLWRRELHNETSPLAPLLGLPVSMYSPQSTYRLYVPP